MMSVPDLDVHSIAVRTTIELNDACLPAGAVRQALCGLFTHPGGTMDNRMHIMRIMFGGQVWG